MYAIKTILNRRGVCNSRFMLMIVLIFLCSKASAASINIDSPIGKVLKYSSLFQAQHQITGRVIDSLNKPIPGVSVLIVGASIATQTDIDGKYVIQGQAGQTIQFRAVGFITKRIVLTNAS